MAKAEEISNYSMPQFGSHDLTVEWKDMIFARVLLKRAKSLIEEVRQTAKEPVSDVTRILQSIESGDAKAAEELMPLVYEELRKLAAHKMAAEAPGQTLQPTALVRGATPRLTERRILSGIAGRISSGRLPRRCGAFSLTTPGESGPCGMAVGSSASTSRRLKL